MTTNQIRLMELQEQIRHNKAQEEVQSTDASTRRKQYKLEAIMRPVEDVLGIVRGFIPSFRLTKTLTNAKGLAVNEANLKAKLNSVKNLPEKEQVKTINYYIQKQQNFKGGNK